MQAGENTYIPQSPCRRGHLGPRRTDCGSCNPCARARECERYQTDDGFREKRKNKNKTERARERNRAIMARLRAARTEDEASMDRHKAKLRSRVWRKENAAHHLFLTTRHRLAKIMRTPVWADQNAIKEIYKNCPGGHEVDHRIPLRGKLVSGLHVEANLQYLTKLANAQKINHWTPRKFHPCEILFAEVAMEIARANVEGIDCASGSGSGYLE